MDMARRSSRAIRTSQPQPNSRHSSAGSASSSRADKTTRSSNKIESPGKTNPTGSLSSEPLDEIVPTVEDLTSTQTRRKRGRIEETRERLTRNLISQTQNPNRTEEFAEDDEAVRCICGLDDYPGPPQLEDEVKSGIREVTEDQLIPVTEVTEDLAGFFLQCDVCKVWQHGGCVGIMNEGTSPDEYFCERCRKDLHKIFTSVQGQRYSHYLPIYQSLSQLKSRTSSFSKDWTRFSREDKSGRPCSNSQIANAKKRSTMNSRDAAYDEEEQLRMAIQASKGEKNGESIDGSSKRAKRSQSDNDEYDSPPLSRLRMSLITNSSKFDPVKRQRTLSASPSSLFERQTSTLLESEECSTNQTSSTNKTDGFSPKNQRQRGLTTDQEVLKLKITSNRNCRSERKRDNDLDHAGDQLTQISSVKSSTEGNMNNNNDDDVNSNNISNNNDNNSNSNGNSNSNSDNSSENHFDNHNIANTNSNSDSDTNKNCDNNNNNCTSNGNSNNIESTKTCIAANSDSTITSLPTNSSNLLTLQVEIIPTTHGSSTPTLPKKGGRPPNSRKGKLNKNQYNRDRDLQEITDHTPHRSQSRDITKTDDYAFVTTIRGSTGEGRTGKFKGNHSKVTMTDMKKRVTAILDFISRTQLEMASESMLRISGDTYNSLTQGINASVYQVENYVQVSDQNGVPNDAKEFKDLSCRDMMDILTKKLIKWQKEFL